jgi:hypothetical protein
VVDTAPLRWGGKALVEDRWEFKGGGGEKGGMDGAGCRAGHVRGGGRVRGR